MHPIVGQFRRLILYLLAWVPLAGILLLLAAPTGLTLPKALVPIAPLCFVYALVCLAAWYPCRFTPLETSGFFRLIGTHLSAATILSGVWTSMAKGFALALSSFQPFRGLDQQIAPGYPLLFGSGVLLYLLSVALHYVLISTEAFREAEQRELEARVLARDSELRALKAQVNPHFLFNSLHSISALTAIDPAKARQMCIMLADFLRATLGMGEKTVIPLRDELFLVHSFLSVEKIRFGARLNLEEKIDPEALDCLVPPLLLQPLVENAIAHGISNLTEGGWIRTTISCGTGPNDLAIVVENNFDSDIPPRRGTGTGLRNVRQRIFTRYGDRATFSARPEENCFRVTMNLPAERPNAVPAEGTKGAQENPISNAEEPNKIGRP
jgi:two-component system sensor histidine kinase AlgZ